MNKTNDDGWISVYDALPGFGEEAEVLFRNKGIEKAKFRRTHGGIEIHGRGTIFDENEMTHWRYPKERKPDFGKLVEGDLIIIEWSMREPIFRTTDKGKACGFFNYFIDEELILRTDYNREKCEKDEIRKDLITKITRINLDEKTFEEI